MKNILRIIIALMIIATTPIGAMASDPKLQELPIYNEWYCNDSNLSPERPFFVIRDTLEFHDFWKKTSFKGVPPYINFEKYMIFVWAPKPTRKDCRNVEIEKLIYKDGCLLVLMNFDGFDKVMTGSSKRPVKATIFPIVDPCDIFVYKKVKKGWQEYEWSPYFALWNLNTERKRPFEYVYLDKENKPLYELATSSGNISVAYVNTNDNENVSTKKKEVRPVALVEPETAIYTPKQSQVTMPRQLPEAQTLSSPKIAQNSEISKPVQPVQPVQNKSVQNTKPTTPAVKATSDPITFGNTPAPKVDKDSKPEVAPGMGEDPLFGSEFDITF